MSAVTRLLIAALGGEGGGVLSGWVVAAAQAQGHAVQAQHVAVGDRELSLRNVNSFLSQYDGGDGVKTGYTEEAGRTLSASATRNGHRVYAVILNDNNRYATAGALIDWAFDNYTWP